MADAKLRKQSVQPVRSSACLFEPALRAKHTHVGLTRQVVAAAIGRIVVDNKEPIDPKASVVLEKRREPQKLVPALGKQPDLPRFRRRIGRAPELHQHMAGRGGCIHLTLQTQFRC